MKPLKMVCCALLVLVALAGCVGLETHLPTPSPESTWAAAPQAGTPIAGEAQAVAAARELLSTLRSMESLTSPEIVFVGRMTLAEAREKAAKPGVGSAEDISADTPVWFVIFEGDWQIHPPAPAQTVTPPAPFHACQYIWIAESNDGTAATGDIACAGQ